MIRDLEQNLCCCWCSMRMENERYEILKHEKGQRILYKVFAFQFKSPTSSDFLCQIRAFVKSQHWLAAIGKRNENRKKLLSMNENVLKFHPIHPLILRNQHRYDHHKSLHHSNEFRVRAENETFKRLEKEQWSWNLFIFFIFWNFNFSVFCCFHHPNAPTATSQLLSLSLAQHQNRDYLGSLEALSRNFLLFIFLPGLCRENKIHSIEMKTSFYFILCKTKNIKTTWNTSKNKNGNVKKIFTELKIKFILVELFARLLNPPANTATIHWWSSIRIGEDILRYLHRIWSCFSSLHVSSCCCGEEKWASSRKFEAYFFHSLQCLTCTVCGYFIILLYSTEKFKVLLPRRALLLAYPPESLDSTREA